MIPQAPPSIITQENQYNRYPINEAKIRQALQSIFNKSDDGIFPSSLNSQTQIYIQAREKTNKKYVVKLSNRVKRLQSLHGIVDTTHFANINNREYLFSFSKQSENYILFIFMQVKGMLKKVKSFEYKLPITNQQLLIVDNIVSISTSKQIYFWKFPSNKSEVLVTEHPSSIAYLPKYQYYIVALSKQIKYHVYQSEFLTIKWNKCKNLQVDKILEQSRKHEHKLIIDSFDSSLNLLKTGFLTEVVVDQEYAADRVEIWKKKQLWFLQKQELKFVGESVDKTFGEHDQYSRTRVMFYRNKGFEYIYNYFGKEGEKVKYIERKYQ